MTAKAHATRWSVRVAARTGVESVCCVPRALIHPRALQVVEIEEPLARLIGEPVWAKIVQQWEVETWVAQVEAERICPIHAAVERFGCLAIGEPFDGPALP
jgi:hypothetical protein